MKKSPAAKDTSAPTAPDGATTTATSTERTADQIRSEGRSAAMSRMFTIVGDLYIEAVGEIAVLQARVKQLESEKANG